MNEFVRRPSRRRDNRVYVPAADIIKRTIRRSWTISNPTPRWSALRGSPELRPYNSLPRGQDITNYPSLALHQTNLKNQNQDPSVSPIRHRRSPTRRTQSEDVYIERTSSPAKPENGGKESEGEPPKRQTRVNPLMKLAETRQSKDRTGSPKRKKTEVKQESGEQEKDLLTPDSGKKQDRSTSIEKRVSFESNVASRITTEKPVLRTQSLNDGKVKEKRTGPVGARSLPEDHTENFEEAGTTTAEIHFAREETTPVELCDIEPLSGTVFRKVTVRRRRQENMRKVPAVDTGKHYGKAVDWMDASGKELSLWKSMLERPNFWVEGCLSLRSSLDTRAS